MVSQSSPFAVLALLLFPLALLAEQDTRPVSIVLHPEAHVLGDIVHLGDLCDIRGGSEVLRQRISELDVAEVGADQPFEVSQWQLRIRLALADIPLDLFRLDGSERVRVFPERVRIGKLDIVNAISTELARQHFVDEGDVEVRLLQAADEVVLANAHRDDVRVEAVLPLNASLGTVRTQVLIYVGGEVHKTIVVPVDAAVYRNVARARSRIARGEAFSEENVATERQRMRSPHGAVAAADVIGRVARRTVQTGTVVFEHHLDDDGPDEDPVLIKVRDPVRLVAQKGGLTVILQAAEALQQGRKGEMIRVRNVKSKKVLTGRVVSDSEVHVVF